MGELIFGKFPLFPSSSIREHVETVISVRGGADLNAYLQKYNIVGKSKLMSLIREYASHEPSNPLETLIVPSRRQYADGDALDLLSKLLNYDHAERLTAHEAMLHPYFDAVRDAQLQGTRDGSVCYTASRITSPRRWYGVPLPLPHFLSRWFVVANRILSWLPRQLNSSK